MIKKIIPLDKITEEDLAIVGGKNAGLGTLARLGIDIPKGCALTTDIFQDYIGSIGLDMKSTSKEGLEKNRKRIVNGLFDKETEDCLDECINNIISTGKTSVAVRSSCTMEDGNEHSFAGQYTSHLNLKDAYAVKEAVKECYSSLFTERVNSYFEMHNLDFSKAKMSVVVQEMIDAKAAGTIFTTDTTTLNNKIMHIDATEGFGEAVVSGLIEADSFKVMKGATPRIISKRMGSKEQKYIATDKNGLTLVDNNSEGFSLREEQVIELVKLAEKAEEGNGPQDIEFVISKEDKIYFVQARPQIVPKCGLFEINVEQTKEKPLITGRSVVRGAGTGTLYVDNVDSRKQYQKGDIIVRDSISVNDVPRMFNKSGLIVKYLSPTSHPAILMREIKVPTMSVGEEISEVKKLDGLKVTIDTSAEVGKLYNGKKKISINEIKLEDVPKTKASITLITSYPSSSLSYLRNSDVEGVHIRGECVISDDIKIHPGAILEYDRKELRNGLETSIKKQISGYSSAREFYINKVTERIVLMSSMLRSDQIKTFRLTDLSSEYTKGLVGTKHYQTGEDNPMLGLRGASWILSQTYSGVLDMELEAVKRAADYSIGQTQILVPFVRSPDEMVAIRTAMNKKNLEMRLGMMVETPASIFLASKFAEVSDYFVVGPSDLTQFVMAADRVNQDTEKYCNPMCEATTAAIEQLFKNLEGKGKDIYVPAPFYKNIVGRVDLLSNNNVKVFGWPDMYLQITRQINEQEKEAGK